MAALGNSGFGDPAAFPHEPKDIGHYIGPAFISHAQQRVVSSFAT